MKIKEDILSKASETLMELLAIQDSLVRTRDALRTYEDECKRGQITLPKFLVARRAELTAAAIKSFSMQFPHVTAMISDGRNSDAGMFRLHDGVYKMGQMTQKLQGCQYMVKVDAECLAIRELANKATADFIVFIITQYGLSQTDQHVFLSVSEYCDRAGITPEVFYGSQLNLLESTGETVYGYESISPYRDDLMDIDATFVAECEENNFPLSEDICQDIIAGTLSMVEARGKLQSWMEQLEQHEVKDITLSNMVQRLNLG